MQLQRAVIERHGYRTPIEARERLQRVSFRSPALFAKMAATADAVSAGRLMFVSRDVTQAPLK
jgi:hypothetical protein